MVPRATRVLDLGPVFRARDKQSHALFEKKKPGFVILFDFDLALLFVNNRIPLL